MYLKGFWVFTLVCMLTSSNGIAQRSKMLEAYIQEALDKNPKIKDIALQLDAQRIQETIASKMWLPELTFGTSYSLAAGGRTIAIPVGDMLNPVYGTLNKLTQSNAFPQIENVEEQLLPNNFYDARFRMRQPILRAEIELNQKIQGVQTTIQEMRLLAVKRELAKEVKLAYFTVLQAEAVLGVFEKNKILLETQRRVQEGLLRNGKLIPSVLERNASELAKLETQRIQAEMNKHNAVLLFNFLLNRTADAAVEIDSTLSIDSVVLPENPALREEILQLQAGKEGAQYGIAIEEARRKPTLSAQFDFGSQSFDFNWGGYALFALSLEVPLWNAGRQKLQVQKARVEALRVDEALEQATRAVELEAQTTQNTFVAARAAWERYPLQVRSAQRYYQETLRRYEEGLASDLELLDAQTQLSTLEIQQTLAFYTVLMRFAELERAWAGFPIGN